VSVVSISKSNGVATVRVNNPPVNALSHALRDELMQAAISLDGDDEVKIVVLICEGRTFIAGADIREFGQPPKQPILLEMINRIEDSKKPWVAAVHGTALGGGFETTMGCHYRVGVPSAKLGLPEVNLGLIPGAGGTVRLPRLISTEATIDIVSSGKPISAGKALELGIFDALAPEGDLETFALDFARSKMDNPMPTGLAKRDPVTMPDEAAVAEIIAQVTKRAKGQISPVKGAETVINSIHQPVKEAFAAERAMFIELLASDQSKSMRHVFFAERQTAKVPVIKEIDPVNVSKLGVIGGGTMGAGISVAGLLAGLQVTMVERDDAAVEAGQQRVEGILAASHKRGVINDAKLDKIKSSFSASTQYSALAEVDMVVEAVFEEMGVKHEVFKQLDAATKPEAILASNTSYMDINKIASVIKDPSRVIGTHFFSPAHIMKLVEVIQSDASSPQAMATGFAFAKKLRKTPVYSGVCEGFIGNRILSTYRACADHMILDGASPYQIDKALTGFGFAMGPFAVADLAGLDIGWAVRKRLAPTRDPRERVPTFPDKLCEQGNFGQKTGKGYYVYEAGKRASVPNPDVPGMIDDNRAELGITPRDFSDEEIVRRYMCAMVNEAAKVVGEGIARRPLDVDMTLLFGYGFPRYRGGPLKWADMAGLDGILADIKTYAAGDAYFWQPAPLLEQLVAEGRSFDDLNKEA